MPGYKEMKKYRDIEMRWQQKFDVTAPKEEDAAPDFELRDVNGANPVRLSDFRGIKPVALVFGSFT